MNDHRQNFFDIGKLLASWASLLVAVNWNAVAAFLTCVFTLLMIVDKLGLLAPLKAFGGRVWRRLRPMAGGLVP